MPRGMSRTASAGADDATDEAAPNAVDVHVGGRVRLRRTLLGMSQSVLGDALGLTFQQVQKYERGLNRISASKLWRLSQVLEVPVSVFFDDIAVDQDGRARAAIPPAGDSGAADANVMTTRETLELTRAYYRIADPAARKALFDLVTALGEPRIG